MPRPMRVWHSPGCGIRTPRGDGRALAVARRMRSARMARRLSPVVIAFGRAPSSLSSRAFAVSSAERLREMNERRQWRRSWWAEKGALAMGALAALALAVTVLFAQHALNDGTEGDIRGEGKTPTW